MMMMNSKTKLIARLLTIASFSVLLSFCATSLALTESAFAYNVTAAGDWGCTSNTTKVVQQMQNKDPDVVLALGDLSYASTADCWFQKIAPLDDQMHIAIGNHDDTSSSLLNQYLNHFDLSKQYYSFDYENTHFLSLSTEMTTSSTQKSFAENDLAAASTDADIHWIVVFFHKPMYTSPNHHSASDTMQTSYGPMFDKYHVDLVLFGHNHSYERTYPIKYNPSSPSSPTVVNRDTKLYSNVDGRIMMTVGMGGQSLYSFDGKASYVVKQVTGKYGMLYLSIGDTNIEARLYDTSGNILDSFTINKSTTTTPPPPPPPPPEPSGGLKFTKSSSNPLMLGHTEPEIIKIGSTYYMYYRADSSSGASIKYATSTDGKAWTDRGTVLTKSSSGWDSGEVIAPSVIEHNGKYYLYYEADNSAFSGKRAIGVATSDSPTGPFTKCTCNPVLAPTESWEGHSSSNYGIVGTPDIFKGPNGKFYLFYHGYTSGSDKGGVAYSDSPTGPFTKESNNPILNVGSSGSWDDSKVAPSDVFYNSTSNKVMVFYEGFNGNQAPIMNWRIGLTEGSIDSSDNGRIKSLSKSSSNPIVDLGPSGAWDDVTVQLPSVIKVGESELWLYYSGNDGSAFRVGIAIAKISAS
jgi:predicted GH43/DUF377 family glycosyl hydrolase/predicted phosphodiesterase